MITMTSKIHHRIGQISIVTAAVLLGIICPVNGQYQSPDGLCGGYFRTRSGSINFVFNTSTNPNPGSRKVCMWTIIPGTSWYKTFHIKLESVNFNCATDRLGYTGFEENSDVVHSHASECSREEVYVTGSALVVTLVSTQAQNGRGFTLKWEMEDFFSRVRFVTIYYSWGKPASRRPYFAWGFMGNAASTFAFPMGNNTQGYTMQMTFTKIKMENSTEACPLPRPGSLCNSLQVLNVSPMGILVPVKTYNETHIGKFVHRNVYGLFLMMWGGNVYNATGGGRMTMSYTSVRGE